MATKSYYISSYYVPPSEGDEEDDDMRQMGEFSTYEDYPLSGEEDEEEMERIWKRGPTYKGGYKICPRTGLTSPVYISDRAAHPPKFVAATLGDEVLQPSTSTTPNAIDPSTQGISSWYKSIRVSDIGVEDAAPMIVKDSSQIMSISPPLGKSYSTPSLPSLPSSPTSAAPSSTVHDISRSPPPPINRTSLKSQKPDWFIQNALRSSSLFPVSSPPIRRISSMTDILSRGPPPLPSEAPFKPITFTRLGPLNKGYAILGKCGWKEGEGLGAWRRETPVPSLTVASEKSPERDAMPRVGEATSGVIDLTLSSGSDDEVQDRHRPAGSETMGPAETAGTVLLQPIPTYLRPDRLGIGASLKGSRLAKGDGPAQKTKLVDSSQVMHASRNWKKLHREKQSRQSALMSRRIKGGKKGGKAFKVTRNAEERSRRDLLAYMNS